MPFTATTGVNLGTTAAISGIILPNIPPTSISCKKTIILSTVDQLNNYAVITEGYTVSGPVCAGATPIVIAGTNKTVIRLGVDVNSNEYFLKVHFPDSANTDKLYVTYCIKDFTAQDGYRDFVNGVPAAFVTTLQNWIANGVSYITPHLVSRSLRFTAYGATTNIPANAVTFYATFSATFGLPR